MISDRLAQVLRDTLEMQIAEANGDQDLAERCGRRVQAEEEALTDSEDEVAQLFSADLADAFRLLRGVATYEELLFQTRAARGARQGCA